MVVRIELELTKGKKVKRRIRCMVAILTHFYHDFGVRLVDFIYLREDLWRSKD